MARVRSVWWVVVCCCVLGAVLLSGVPAQAVSVVAGSEREFGGHTYALLTPSNWPDAEAFAVTQGARLVVIGDAEENQWVWDTYSALMTSNFIWIGLFQPDGSPEPDGGWQWVDGSPLTFEAWKAGEPNNQGDEKYAHLQGGAVWNDAGLSYYGTCQGVMEFGEWAGFPDVPSDHWAYHDIMACYASGIVQGFPDGLYHPDDSLRRSQMAVFIARAVAGGDAFVPSGPAEATFPDVPSTGQGEYGTRPYWAYDYIEYCAAHGIVQGYWDGTYRPELVVNRGQMAVYIARAVVSPPGDPNVPDPGSEDPPAFPDVTADNDWAWCYKYVQYIAGLEPAVVQGYPDGTYGPGVEVTRDQMAVYVARAFGLPM